eukprot:364247-Chlamydomonas_euryale.AAC.15
MGSCSWVELDLTLGLNWILLLGCTEPWTVPMYGLSWASLARHVAAVMGILQGLMHNLPHLPPQNSMFPSNIE